MKEPVDVMAEAVRVELDDQTGEVFIVFKVIDHNFRKDVITNWKDDLEYKVVNKKLIKNK